MFKKFSVAPLYKYTDRHCRYFYSLLSNNIKLYTGMIYTSSFLYKYKINRLFLNDIKNVPVVIQFIGNNSYDLYKSAKLVRKLNFSEINFNLGCTSRSSYFGKMGFYLMSNINNIINCVNSLILGSKNINVSVKHRLNYYCYNSLLDFVGTISLFTRCNNFIIHPRYILKNIFSTKLNFKIPKLNYNWVYKLKKDLPHLNIIINGNINNIKDIDYHLKYVDGVMMGRKIYSNPLILINIDNYINSKKKKYKKINFFINNRINPTIRIVFLKLYLYILKQIKLYNIHPLKILKHVVNIFKGINNASLFKRRLIQSSYNFNFFPYFYNFENFLYKEFI